MTTPKPALAAMSSNVANSAGAARHVTLDEQRKTRRALAVDRDPCPRTTEAERRAQQHDRANGGRLQVSLGPLKISEASCTIHCTSSSIVVARERTLGCRPGDRSERTPFPGGAVVEAEIRNSSRPGSQAHMRRLR